MLTLTIPQSAAQRGARSRPCVGAKRDLGQAFPAHRPVLTCGVSIDGCSTREQPPRSDEAHADPQDLDAHILTPGERNARAEGERHTKAES